MAWLAEGAARAFLEVGVLVAVLLALVGRVQHRSGDVVVSWLVRHHRWGPLVGASLGALPGCGGALVVMPVYLRGTVTFGTVVAALVATMGDASFVLLATRPATAIGVHVSLLVVGGLSGLLVDALGIAPARAASLQRVAPARLAVAGQAAARTSAGASVAGHDPGSSGSPGSSGAAGGDRHRAGPGPDPDPSDPDAGPAGSDRLLRAAILLFWGFVALGAGLTLARLLGVPVGMRVPQADGTAALSAPHLEVLVGVAGLSVCLLLVALGRGRGRALGCTVAAQAGEVLTAAARETAVVVCWVAVAFLVVEVAVVAAGVDLAALPVLGLAGVLLGAGLGLVPGCGPHLVLTGLYVQGVVPVPMLLANALSQDGDALLPLLVLDRRAALLGTALSTLPGVLVGSVLVGLGW
jgi:hypothetical protein